MITSSLNVISCLSCRQRNGCQCDIPLAPDRESAETANSSWSAGFEQGKSSYWHHNLRRWFKRVAFESDLVNFKDDVARSLLFPDDTFRTSTFEKDWPN